MRKLFILFSMIALLLISINKDFSVSKASSMDGYEVSYISPVMSPIEPNSIVTINGTTLIKEGTSRNKLRIKYELYSPFRYNGTKTYSSGYASSLFNYPNQNEIPFSFTIDDHVANFAREGIKVKLGIYDTSARTYVHYIERTLYSKKVEEIDINDINGDLVINKAFNLGEEEELEIYNFSNLSHIVEIDYYHHLDISSLNFVYKGYKAFSYEEAYLTFNDEHNLYPLIKEDNNKKVISLKLIQTETEISFAFNDLYVNKATLEMSSVPREEYLKTNYFYFPKNKLNSLQGLSFDINVRGMGSYPLSFNYSFIINIDALLIGPCSLSEYCVVGGVKR